MQACVTTKIVCRSGYYFSSYVLIFNFVEIIYMHNYIKLALLSSIPLIGLAACSGGSGASTGGANPQPGPAGELMTKFSDVSDSVKLEIHDVSDTVFAGKTYAPEFIFTNNSDQPLTFASLNIPEPAVWNLVSNNCTYIAPNGGTCTITGNFSLPTAGESSSINIVLNGANGTQAYSHVTNVAAVAQAPDNYLAIKLNFPVGGTQKIFAAVSQLNDNATSNVMVLFNKDSDGYKGVKTTDTNINPTRTYNHYAVQVAGPGAPSDILYIPKGGSGVIYLSIDQTLSDGPPPDINGGDMHNINTEFQTIEFSNNGDITYANLTNVDHVSIPMEMDWVVDSSERRVGANYNMLETPMTEVLNSMAIELESHGAWGSLVQRNESNEIIRIMSPSKKIGFDTSDFTQYIEDVWSFYKQTDAQGKPLHYIYVDVTEAARRTCKVRGFVSAADNLFHFEPLPGYTDIDCPQTPWDPNESRVPGTNSPTFTKFQANDFLKGASGADLTTWGMNGSYRSVIGRSIVSAQSIGFLPFCPDTSLNYNGGNGNLFSDTYFPLYYTPQYLDCMNPAATYDVINQYAAVTAQYFNYYNYAYSDAIGKDGTLVGKNALYPMTITVGKMK